MKTTLSFALAMSALLLVLGCSPTPPAENKTETPAPETTATEEAPAEEAAPAEGTAPADGIVDGAATDGTTTEGTTTTTPDAAAGASPVWTADEDKMAQVTASGLKILITKPGEGAEAANTNTVVVNYIGWLTDGTQFDANQDPDPTKAFTLAPPWGVIQGWQEGLVGMKKGEVRKLYIPSALGYGPNGGGPIPPNADLVFQVTMLEIK